MTNDEPEAAPRPIQVLSRFVQSATIPYRKGAVYKEEEVDGIKVVTVDDFPAVDLARGPLVDVHFISVGFTEASAISKDVFLKMCDAAWQGEFVDVTPEVLDGGPSYLTLGGWLGDQTVALCFLALGARLGAWEVITPERLGATGDKADLLAGRGMVMNAGVKR